MWVKPGSIQIRGVIKMHNSWLIIFNQIKETILDSLYPFTIALDMSVLIFIIFGLIRIDYPISVFLFQVIMTIVDLAYLYCFIQIPSLVEEKFKIVFDKMRKKILRKDKYLLKVMKSLKPFQFVIGHFHNIEKHTWIDVMDTTINQTVNLLITFG